MRQRTIQLSDFFPILIGSHSQMEVSARSWPNIQLYTERARQFLFIFSFHYSLGNNIPVIMASGDQPQRSGSSSSTDYEYSEGRISDTNRGRTSSRGRRALRKVCIGRLLVGCPSDMGILLVGGWVGGGDLSMRLRYIYVRLPAPLHLVISAWINHGGIILSRFHQQKGLITKWACHNQSATKPNLVAKILATKIGNLWA